MEELNIKNLRFHSDHFKIYRNSVLKREMKFEQVDSLKVVSKRGRWWYIAVSFGIILFLAGLSIFPWAINLFFNEITFRSATVFVALGGIGAMFIYLGIQALLQYQKNTYLVINNAIEVEVDRGESDKVIRILKLLNNHKLER